MNDTPNPMFAKFDQVLGVKTPTTTSGPISTRANEIRNLATQTQTAKTDNVSSRIKSDIFTAGKNVNSAIHMLILVL